mgnify:CR=1 FL=1
MESNTTFLQEQEDKRNKQAELKKARLSKLASIFARTNSVLTSKRISVSVVDNESVKAPAYSSTHEVWLNSSHIKDDFSARSLISLNGLDFHELSHLRFTPRNAHALPTWVKENDLWQAFNALEDMRIENLMVAQLPSVATWLTTTICDYLLDDEKAIQFSFALTYGRKYLPTDVQQLAIDNFARPDLIAEFEMLIDEYNTFVFDDKDMVERAKEIISRYAELLKDLGNSADPFGHESRPAQGYESSSNRPASASEQKKLRDKSESGERTKVKRNAPADKSDEAKDNSDSNSNDKSKENQIADRNEKVAERNSETDFNDLEFDEFDYDDDDIDYGGADYEQAPDKQVGNQNGSTGDNKQVTDTLNDVISNAVADLSKDVTSIAKQLGIQLDLVGGNVETPQHANFNEVVAPAELVLVQKAFAKELERLKAKHDPAWEYETELGNLNVMRYLNDEEFDTCFDEWQEGRADVTDIEAVILLDKSGSMGGVNADEAYKSMWAIKKSLESVNARTSVVLFDMRSYLLYGADEKATHTIRDGGASGGTNPEHSLLYAKKVLADSDKKIKLLFMITDGAWDTKEGEQAIRDMRSAGILTCQAYLSQYEVSAQHLNEYRHGFELLTQIKTAKDILTLGKDLVRIAIARNLVAR